MKLLLACFAITALLCSVNGQATKDEQCGKDVTDWNYIPNCSTCINYAVQCMSCLPGQAMTMDKRKCENCPDFCSECEITGAGNAKPTCNICIAGYYLEDGKCKACKVSECAMCDPKDTCQDCYFGWALEVNGNSYACLECPGNCKTCSLTEVNGVNQTTCDSCDSKFYRNSVGSSVYECKACASTCLDCTGTACRKCKDGYALNADTGSCVVCPANCKVCEWNALLLRTDCKDCVSLNYQVNLISGQCQICQSDCAKCESLFACSECNPFFYVAGSACSSCDTNCIKCSATECDTCATGFTVNEDINDKTCDVCPTFCNACNQNGCQNCWTGYTIASDGSCKKCGTGCNTCDAAGTCSSCQPGYAVYSGNCYACPGGCNGNTCSYDTAISTTKCTTCASGYVFNTLSTTCHACPSHCTNPGTCLFNDTAIAGRSTICATAGCDLYYEEKGGMCEACPPYCTACAWNAITTVMDCDPTSCDNAVPMIQLVAITSDTVGSTSIVDTQNYCKPCVVNGCTDCTGDASACVTCDTGYTDDLGTGCSPCPAECATGCAMNTTGLMVVNCATCNSGYGIDAEETTCTPCSVVGSGCGSCHWAALPLPATWVCDGCVSRYFYNTTTEKCGSCASNCLTCNVAGASKCDVNQCFSGYVRNDADLKCYMCPAFCSQCSYSATPNAGEVPDQCDICISGYTLDTEMACQVCPDNCHTCSWVSGTAQCDTDECHSQYALDVSDGTCHACPPNCQDCIYNADGYTQCITCMTAFFTNDQVCSACPPNCDSCSISEGTNRCGTCRTGYTVDNGFCKACISNCLECSSVDTCNLCRPGYGKAGDSKSCVDCATLTAVGSCSQCTDQDSLDVPALCLDCSFGFTLADNSLDCHDTGGTTDCWTVWDPPPVCLACESGYNVTSHGWCGTMCSVCGSPNDMQLEEECNAEGTNYTVVECVGHDSCMMIWEKDTSSKDNLPLVARGCFRNTTCGEDNYTEEKDKKGECKTNKNAKVKNCLKCCKGANCNDYMFQGQAAVESSLGLLFATIVALFALRSLN